MALPRRIDLVVFDIGGVLAHIDKTPLRQLLKAYNIGDATFFDEDFYSLQSGSITPSIFFERKSNLEVPIDALHSAWCAMVDATVACENLALVKRPYLFLSNINTLHFEALCARAPVAPYAREHSVLSYQVGYLKPHVRIFQIIREKIAGGSSALFIDDKEENLIRARQFNLSTAHCPSPQSLRAVLLAHDLI